MDADTIRLILIIVGIVLILALYLWERSRDRDDDADDGDAFDDDGDALPPDPRQGSQVRKREPNLGALDEDDGYDDDPPPRMRKPAADIGGGGRRESPARAARRASRAENDLQPLLIQLSVSARGEPFDGLELLDAAEGCGLHPGEMEIFHCLDEFEDGNRIYFSMANMVKPGTFPFDDMASFATPGVMLFAQLEGDPEDMTVLDEMVATARKLASVLDGEVLDETRRPLTVRKEEALREAILENERRWMRMKPW